MPRALQMRRRCSQALVHRTRCFVRAVLLLAHNSGTLRKDFSLFPPDLNGSFERQRLSVHVPLSG